MESGDTIQRDMRDTMWTIKETVMDSILGKVEVSTKVSFRMI